MFGIQKLIALVVLVPALIGVSACERIALMPRPDIDREGRPIDRADRDRGEVSAPLDRDNASARDVVGTVERLDRASHEIQLRTSEGRLMIVSYDSGTMVYDRDQEIGIDGLRPRDQVLVRLSTNSRGQQYADTVRLNDSRTLGSRTY